MATPAGTARRRVSPTTLGVGALIIAALLVPVVYLVSQATAPSQVTGVVLGVRTRAPLGVDSFDLLASDGRRLTFTVGQLDVSTGFDAGHLVSHQLTLQPVIVTYRQQGYALVAIRLADGPVVALPTAPSQSATGPRGAG